MQLSGKGVLPGKQQGSAEHHVIREGADLPTKSLSTGPPGHVTSFPNGPALPTCSLYSTCSPLVPLRTDLKCGPLGDTRAHFYITTELGSSYTVVSTVPGTQPGFTSHETSAGAWAGSDALLTILKVTSPI